MEYEEDVYVDILDEGPVDKEDYGDFKGKGIVESGEFDRWDGGSVSGADESDHFYNRYRNEGRDYGESRSYKVRSVVENDAEFFDKRKRHEAEDKGGSLSDRYWREAESDEGEEEEGQFSRRHIKHGSGYKERKRNYRRRTVVDGDSSDEEDEERFTRKLNMHGFKDKERERKYRRKRVVDDDYSDEEAEEEELQMGKLNMHVSEDKEHSRNYSHRRVVIDDHSDDKVEEQFTKKLIIRGYGDKDHKRIYRRRRVVDDDYSDDEAEEPQITRKVIKHGPGDKQHSRNSKRRKVIGDDYSDNDFEFVAKHSKERDDSGGQDQHSRRILSRRHSRSKDEKMSEGHIEKDRDRSRHRDDSHERKRDHRHDKHLKHDMYNNVKERGGDVEVDKYKRRRKDVRHSTRYTSENDDEDDWEREILEKERDYDYMKERGRNVKEEKYDRRRDMHHSARYQSEHDDDYEWEMAIMERKTDYVYIKERGNGAEEDKYNRRPRSMRHSTRYQTDHDDDDWEREMMERERCSWERGREMNDNSYEMKHSKREKDGDFRGRDKESLMRTSLIERGKERDVRGQTGDIWEESQVINQHVKGKMGRREWNYVRRDLREQITEAKEKSHRIELTDGEKEGDSTEQQSQSLDMSLKRELEERQKDRDLRGRDKECIGKSKEIQRNKESKWGSRKMNLSESTVSKLEIEPSGRIREKEKIHKVIRKKDLIERDITSMEDSHKSKWDREMGEIISKRDFCQKDSGKQDMEDQMRFVKETDSEDYNMRSREMSQEIGWDRKTRQRYQKREFMSRDQREREGRHIILERDSVCQLNEKLIKKQDKEKREELWERGFNNDDRDFVERDTWKPSIEIRVKSLEKEVMHKENERESKYGDVHREKSHLKELLNKAEENRRGKGDKMNHKKTLENDSDDNGNQRDLMIWDADMENSRQKELLNKEEGKSRRDSVKINHDNALENDSLDKENDRNSAARSSVCREKCTKTIEGETIRELQEEKEKCREQRKETKADEAEADAGTESERQQKTIFAYQISTKANDRDVYEFFLKAGKVRDVRLVMDPIGRHFIGVGYIEFYHSMSIPAAVLLSGKLLHGQPVMIKPPEADDNQVHSIKNAGGSDISGPCPGGCNKLCVGNLHDSVTEALLHQVFEAFGTIELVQFDSAEARHCERKCIIQFARLEDAQAARSLSGHLALAGQLIKVSPISDHDEVQVVSVDTNDCNEAEGNDLVSDIGVQNEVQVACADTNRCNEAEGSDLVSDIGVQNVMQGSDAKTIASSEEKGSGMVPVGQLESALQKLEPSGNELNKSSSPADVNSLTLPSESLKHLVPPPSIQAFVTSLKAVLQVPGAAIPIVDTVGVPSECLHLMNMFDSNIQASEEFELRVKEDIEELCYKFGKPKEIHIDKNSAGSVYLRFKDTEAAIVAQRTLHGRWFAGKMITATYMDRQIYDAKFPCIEQTSAQGQPPLAWLPHNYGPRFPINGQTLAQGPTSAMWLPQTFGSNFPTGQQPLAPGATSAMWMPNNNPVAFGAGFGNGGQFIQPLVPRGNTFPDMRPNIW